MKKWIWYFLGVVAIGILALAYSISDFSVMNILPKGALPEKYKTYLEIEKGSSSKQYQVSLLFSSDNEMRLGDFPPIFNAANNTVIVARQTEIKKGDNTELHKTFLKLNANGELIDSITYKKDWPMDWGGYLITPKVIVAGYSMVIKKYFPMKKKMARSLMIVPGFLKGSFISISHPNSFITTIIGIWMIPVCKNQK